MILQRFINPKYKRQYIIGTVATMVLLISLIVFLVSYSHVLGMDINGTALKDGCFINIDRDFTTRHPILLQDNKNEFILPHATDDIQLGAGDKARLVCAGTRFTLANVQEVTITCISGQQFLVNPSLGERQFKDLSCTDFPDATARNTGSKCLGNKYTEVEIGFNTKAGFVRTIRLCFDTVLMDSIYSEYNLSSQIHNQQHNVPRPGDFAAGSYYPGLKPAPSTLYKRNSQRTGFARILGSKELAEKYIGLTDDYFLSRGHLTAKADFVYGSQQLSTFFYINVAPQWQTFNGRNWNELEQSCREFAANSGRDLVVYSGVYGNAQLPNVHGELKNLSLFVGTDGANKITVPDVFWKLLHDPKEQTAVVFVGHNNPYDTDVAKRVLCEDICDKFKWLSWDAQNITSGYSYCCEYSELKQIVQQMPDISVNGILS